MDALLADLFIYPVKSCGGTRVSTSTVTQRGLAHDREWMIVDSNGRFITQREEPRLALVAPRLGATTLQFVAPGMPALDIGLEAGRETVSVTVFRDTVSAHDQGDEIAAWLSGYLGRGARLVRFDPAARRLCNPQFAGDSGAHTAFADGYPMLVISQASLADLNDRLTVPLPMNRFRPNIVLAAIDAYDEDHLTSLAIGGVTLRMVKPCVRCQITTTDQATASVGVEPLPTLAGYRRDDSLGGVTFGMNAVVVAGEGEILAVGDSARCTFDF